MGSRTPPPISTPPSERGADDGIGKYEIIKRLAKGGMAEIFLAQVRGTIPGFRKVVVLKRILPEFAAQPAFVNMFFDEARLAATLQHPNIVQVFDVGVDDGQYYMAMEYLHGEDVRAIMRAADHRIPIEHALHIGLGLCAGLHYAHEKLGFDGQPLDIVHRDISPQNVIVTFDGAVKLLDFGIAKASNQEGETRIGELKGKVPYMSPEQCQGAPLDRRSDIFSLGICLYEITAGRRLYAGKSDFDVMREIVDGRVTPPRDLDPLYHPTLEAIVMRALEKDPAKRFQTVREMQVEIESLARRSHVYVSPTGLETYMARLFGTKIEAWRVAQRQGKSLIEHLETLLFEAPVSVSTAPSLLPRLHLDEPRPGPRREPVDDFRRESSLPRSRLDTPFELPIHHAPEAAPPPGPPSVALAEDPVHTAVARATSAPVPAPAPRSSPTRPRRRPVAPRPRLLRIGLIAIPLAVMSMLAGAWVHSRIRNPRPQALVAGALQPLPSPPSLPSALPSTLPSAVTEPPRAPPPPIEYGVVTITTQPPHATLYLDGTRIEKVSPVTVDRVEVGREHVLLVQLKGKEDRVEHFTLEPGAVMPLSLRLAPARRPRWPLVAGDKRPSRHWHHRHRRVAVHRPH